jgi:hypothetical protein
MNAEELADLRVALPDAAGRHLSRPGVCHTTLASNVASTPVHITASERRVSTLHGLDVRLTHGSLLGEAMIDQLKHQQAP